MTNGTGKTYLDKVSEAFEAKLVPRVFAFGKQNTLVWADDVTYINYVTKWGWVVFSCMFRYAVEYLI